MCQEVRNFTEGAYDYYAMKYFSKCITSPLELEVDKRLVIDCSDFMMVNKINKRLLGLTQSNVFALGIGFPIPYGFGNHDSRGE